MFGESLSDVPPGYLPRTLEELRTGTTSESSVNTISESRNSDPLHYNYPTTEHLDIDPEDRIFDLEPTSDTTNRPRLFPTNLPTASLSIYSTPFILTQNSTASSLDAQVREESNHHDHASSIRGQFRRVAALRHKVQRLRAGVERVISGLQDLGEAVPDSRNALQHTNNLTTRLSNLEAYLNTTANTAHNPQQAMDDVMDWDGVVEESHRPANFNPQVTLDAQGHAHNFNNVSTGGTFNSPAGLASYQAERAVNTLHGNQHQIYPDGMTVHASYLLDARRRLDGATADLASLQDQRSATGTDQGQVHARLREAINYREQCEREVSQFERNQQQLQQLSQQNTPSQQHNSDRFSTPSRQTAPIWSSREEMERLGDEYESPISGLFNAWGGRYNAAEARRQQERAASEAIPTMLETAPESGTSSMDVRLSERARTVDEVRHELNQEQQSFHPRNYEVARRRVRSNRNPQQPAMPPLQIPTPGPPQRSYLSAMIQGSRSGQGSDTANTDTLRMMRQRLLNAETRDAEHSRQSGNRLSFPPPIGGEQPYSYYSQQPTRPGSQAPPVFTFPGHRTPQETAGHTRDESRAELLARRIGAARLHGLTYDSEGEELSNSDIERLMTTGFARRREPEAPKSLDKDDGRPEPVSEENMMVKMECKICFAQVATVALLPCGMSMVLMLTGFLLCRRYISNNIHLLTLQIGHCVMCKWCANEAVPSHKLDQTAPASTRAQCPVCRRKVKQKVDFYSQF